MGPAIPMARPRRFPWLTTRDAVEAETRLADALGIDAFHLVIGASAKPLTASPIQP